MLEPRGRPAGALLSARSRAFEGTLTSRASRLRTPFVFGCPCGSFRLPEVRKIGSPSHRRRLSVRFPASVTSTPDVTRAAPLARRGAPETHRLSRKTAAAKRHTRARGASVTHGISPCAGLGTRKCVRPAASCAGSLVRCAHVGASRPRRPRDANGLFAEHARVCDRPTRCDNPPLSVRKDRPTSSRRSGDSVGGSHRTSPRGCHATRPGALAPRTPSERAHVVPVLRGRRPGCVFAHVRARWVRCTSRRRFMRTRGGARFRAPLAVPRP